MLPEDKVGSQWDGKDRAVDTGWALQHSLSRSSKLK